MENSVLQQIALLRSTTLSPRNRKRVTREVSAVIMKRVTNEAFIERTRLHVDRVLDYLGNPDVPEDIREWFYHLACIAYDHPVNTAADYLKFGAQVSRAMRSTKLRPEHLCNIRSQHRF